MKKTKKTHIASIVGIFVLVAIIGFCLAACGGDDDTDGGNGDGSNGDGGNDCDASCLAIGAFGPGGGKIIYHNHSGFNVTDLGKCYYLEAAPVDASWSRAWAEKPVDVIHAARMAIGTGKANTAAIIAAHTGNIAYRNVAQLVEDFNADTTKNGGKTDWFLPSKDELNEMYKARNYLGMRSELYWSSSQIDRDVAWCQYFDDSDPNTALRYKYVGFCVRVVRAF